MTTAFNQVSLNEKPNYLPTDFNDFRIETVRPKDFDDLIRIQKDFISNEPLGLGLHTPEEERMKIFTERVKGWCASELSLIATYTPENEIAAFLVATILTRENKNVFELIDEKLYGLEVCNLTKILHHLEQSFNVFDNPNIHKVWEITILCVKQEFSSRGLGYYLMQESEKMAVLSGCHAICSALTNKITQNMFSKIGYQVVFALNFEDLEINGEKMNVDLNETKGTTKAQVVVKYLEENQLKGSCRLQCNVRNIQQPTLSSGI